MSLSVGRLFNASGVYQLSPLVIIINQNCLTANGALATHLWPCRQPCPKNIAQETQMGVLRTSFAHHGRNSQSALNQETAGHQCLTQKPASW